MRRTLVVAIIVCTALLTLGNWVQKELPKALAAKPTAAAATASSVMPQCVAVRAGVQLCSFGD